MADCPQYEEDLRDCRHCAFANREAETRREARLLRYLAYATEMIVLVFILCAGLLTYASWHATSRSTAFGAVAPTAPEPKSEDGKWVPVRGELLLTLTLPKSEMGSSANASQKARKMAWVALDAIPSASSVAVFDGNCSLIGRYRR